MLCRFCSTGLDYIYSISTTGHSFSSDFQEKSTFSKSSGWFVGHLLCFPFDFSVQLFSVFSLLPPPCALFPSLLSRGHYSIVPAHFSAPESRVFLAAISPLIYSEASARGAGRAPQTDWIVALPNGSSAFVSWAVGWVAERRSAWRPPSKAFCQHQNQLSIKSDYVLHLKAVRF